MKKKNILINLLLILLLAFIVFIAIFFLKKIVLQRNERRAEEEANKPVVLKDIQYGSEIVPVFYKNAEDVIDNFIKCYNSKDGQGLVANINLVAMYIYATCEDKNNFDKTYEETLSDQFDGAELMLMQRSLQNQELNLILGITNNSVQLTLIETSEVKSVSKYISKMKVKLQTVSEDGTINQIDTLEFTLLHRDNAYSIIQYDLVDSQKN